MALPIQINQDERPTSHPKQIITCSINTLNNIHIQSSIEKHYHNKFKIISLERSQVSNAEYNYRVLKAELREC